LYSVACVQYLPYKHEDVVGVITKKSGDQYVIDIGIKDRVTLSKFGFEGATKKNKPDLKVSWNEIKRPLQSELLLLLPVFIFL